MSIIIGDTIYCPLCEKQMVKRNIRLVDKDTALYLCAPCNIGIYEFDPALNKWRDAEKKIPCPNCGKPLKWFARYMDGYFKAVCPYCKTVMRKDGDVKFGESGNIIVPEEMEEDTEETVEVKIPLAHLAKKLGKEKFNALKARLKKRQK